MNYIVFDSLIDKKVYLHQMFVSPKWQENRYAKAGIKGSNMENLVTRQTFSQWAKNIVKAIKPLYEAIRTMDSERYPQIGFLYHKMERAKDQIRSADLKHAHEYIQIIEHQQDYQMGGDLYLANKQQIKNALKI